MKQCTKHCSETKTMVRILLVFMVETWHEMFLKQLCNLTEWRDCFQVAWFFLIILRSDWVISIFPHFPRIKCSFPKGSVQLILPFNIYRLIRTVLSLVIWWHTVLHFLFFLTSVPDLSSAWKKQGTGWEPAGWNPVQKVKVMWTGRAECFQDSMKNHIVYFTRVSTQI